MLPTPINHPNISLHQILSASEPQEASEAQFFEFNEQNARTPSDTTSYSQIYRVHCEHNYSLPLPGLTKPNKHKYPRICCVGGCGNRENNQNISLHSFPKDKKIAMQWKRKLKIKNQSTVLRVCSKHFKPTDFFPIGNIHIFKFNVIKLKVCIFLGLQPYMTNIDGD